MYITLACVEQQNWLFIRGWGSNKNLGRVLKMFQCSAGSQLGWGSQEKKGGGGGEGGRGEATQYT